MLLAARAGRRGRRRGRCGGYVRGHHPELPRISLTHFYRCPVALKLSRGTALAFFNRTAPLSVFPCGIAVRAYSVGGKRIVRYGKGEGNALS